MKNPSDPYDYDSFLSLTGIANVIQTALDMMIDTVT